MMESVNVGFIPRNVVSSRLTDQINVAIFNHVGFNKGKRPNYIVLSSKTHETLSHECDMDFYDSSLRGANGMLRRFNNIPVVIIPHQTCPSFSWSLGA